MTIVNKISTTPPTGKISIPGFGVFSALITITMAPEWFKELTLSWTYPIEWDLPGGSPVFNVYRSGSEETDYEKLNTFPLTGLTFLDVTTRQDSKNHKDYYIVQAVLQNGDVYHSEPTALGESRFAIPNVRAREITRREWLLLRKFVGVPVLIFKEKTEGARCPECWSEKHQKTMKSKCTTCMGTGFLKGYYDPFKTYVQFPDASSHTKLRQYFGNLEPNQEMMWTINYPDIAPRSVILKPGENQAFLVDQVQKTELQTEGVRQILSATELPHDHIIFKLYDREGLV